MRQSILLTCLLFLFSQEILSQDFSSYETRRQALLKSLSSAELIERGKHGLPKAIARLHNNPGDAYASEYITNILEHPEQTMFDFPGVALALCRYWDSFNVKQLNKIKSDLEKLAKPDKQGGEGFLGHGTENHATMMWCSAYLFGQLFPDARWANGMTSDELMADMKERLRKTFKNVYQKGYVEYLSSTYEIVMNFPVAILLEYAHDPEVKAIAEAFLLYKWSLLALNNYEGYIIAPYGRMNTAQDFYRNSKENPSATNYFTWLMWGWGPKTGNVELSDFSDGMKKATSYGIYAALSSVVPDSFFSGIANNAGTPYMVKTSASTFGHYGTGVPQMMMRKVYRHRLFAIGTGNFRWVPGGDYADHDTNGFSIVWHSPDPLNYIGCFHPYWYSDGDDGLRTPDTWEKGNISPFQQTAHDKNTVVTLFDIPDSDPWLNTPSPSKWAWRDGHAQALLRRGMVRYPKSVDEKVESKGWIFLREGDTFIGIRPLKSYYEQSDLTEKGLEGFNIIKSDHGRTGFVFELGTVDEFGTFQQFQDKLVENELSVDWENMTVTYTDSQKDKIRIEYRAGLPVKESNVPDHLSKRGIKGLAASVPSVIVNGREDPPYHEWPVIESPFINMKGGVLKIRDGEYNVTVDWTGYHPDIRSK